MKQSKDSYQYIHDLTFDEAKARYDSNGDSICISFTKTIKVDVALFLGDDGILVKLNPKVGEGPWVDLELESNYGNGDPHNEDIINEILEAFGIDRKDKIWTLETYTISS